MLATVDGVNFVRARIAAATVLAICTLGCRQVDTLALDSGAATGNQLQTLPTAVLCSPPPPTAQIVKVCRIPVDESEASPSAALDEISPVNDVRPAANPEASGLPSCDECAPLPTNFGDASKGLAELAIDPAETDVGQQRPQGEAAVGSFKSECGHILAETRDNVLQDYSNFYSRNTLGEFVVILAPAAVFANSDFDADVGDWYQTHIRSADTNRAANFLRPLGNGYYTIPFYVSAKFLGEYFEDRPGMSLLGEFGDRTTRALLVGGPPFLSLQYLTGGGRPSVYADESYWRPFRGSHGASGHAFMGAVPFLTMAGMTDDPLAKCIFYACSPWTGFTRINDNVHYLSQVWLGWWMAYLACDAVNKTEKEKGPFVITPMCTPEMTGIGLIYQH